jgi:SHS2 domain-containing protein
MGIKRLYRFIDHTADLGIVVRGKDPKGLFRNAALALVDIVGGPTVSRPQATRNIDITGDDWPDLMVNWLREILYLWNGEACLVNDVHMKELSEKRLHAEVAMEAYQPDIHTIKTEVKAVTYHQVKMGPIDGEWEAQIIFDT